MQFTLAKIYNSSLVSASSSGFVLSMKRHLQSAIDSITEHLCPCLSSIIDFRTMNCVFLPCQFLAAWSVAHRIVCNGLLDCLDLFCCYTYD